MSVGYIEVDTSRLDSDIREIRADTAGARNTLNKMKSELDALNGMWEGTANAAFRQETDKDYQAMLSMLDTIDKLMDCMENAKREYTKCERSVYGTVNSIQI